MFGFKTIRTLINIGPLIFLYYLSISEIDTHFENYFEILSFNIQLIIIYFWVSKRSEVLGGGHIFFADNEHIALSLVPFNEFTI